MCMFTYKCVKKGVRSAEGGYAEGTVRCRVIGRGVSVQLGVGLHND